MTGNGLLDLSWLKEPEGVGLLGALAGYAANAQRGAPINSLGRGGLSGLLAYSNAAERQQRHQDGQLQRDLTGLKVTQLRTDLDRQRLIQEELRKVDGQGNSVRNTAAVVPQLDQAPTDQYGTAGAGGVPLFSAGGADRFGSMPVGTYTAPQPQTSMPTAPQQPMPFNVGAAGQRPGMGGAQGGFNAQSGGPSVDYDRLVRQARVYERAGDVKTSTDLLTLAERFRPKFATDFRQVKDPTTGQLINVMVAEDGRVVPVPYGVKPDIQLQELGGHVGAIDKNNTQGGTTWTKSPTFADRTAAGNLAVSQGNLSLAQERFGWEQNQPQYMSTDNGIVALPKRPQPGAPITGFPVSVQGQSSSGPKLTEVQGNSTQFGSRMLDASRIVQELEGGKDAPWPSTVARAGYSPEFPSWMPGGQVAGAAVRSLNNVSVPQGAQRYHQAMTNWVTANLRKESGAAIPVPELEQEFRKWFPQPGDSQELIQQKAEARRVAEQTMLVQAGPGRTQAERIASEAAARSAKGKAQPLPTNPTASSLRKGTVYDMPNGSRARWDGMRFVEEQ